MWALQSLSRHARKAPVALRAGMASVSDSTHLETEAAKKLFSRAAVAGGQPESINPDKLDAVARAAPAREPSTADKVAKTIMGILGWGGLAAAGGVAYATYTTTIDECKHRLEVLDTDTTPLASYYADTLRYYIVQREWAETKYKEYADPPTDTLLPSLHPTQRAQIRTLVLDLDDVLIHSDWNRQRGWVTFKRPGVSEFLQKLCEAGFELVLFTDQLNTYSDPIMDKLDPGRSLVPWRLTRNCTTWLHGTHVRDLSKLNRDMDRVLFLTTNRKAAQLQPENCVVIKPYKDPTAEDTVLLELLPFFEMIMRTQVKDVRDVVRSYGTEDIVTAFRKRMEGLKAAQQQAGTKQTRPRFLSLGR